MRNFKLDSIGMTDLNGKVAFYYDRNMDSQNLNTVADEAWFLDTIAAKGHAVIIPPHENEYTYSNDVVVSVCRAIINPYNDKVVGVLKIDQKLNTFEQIFSNVDLEQGEINIVYDSQGNVFYTNTDLTNAQLSSIFNTSSFLEQGKNKIVMSGSSTDGYWKMFSLVDAETISSKAEFIKRNNFILAISLFIVCTALSIIVSFTINNPIRKLITSIQSFQNENCQGGK